MSVSSEKERKSFPSSVAEQSKEGLSYNQSALEDNPSKQDLLSASRSAGKVSGCLQDKLRQALGTSFVFKSCSKAGPYPYEKYKGTIDEKILSLEKVLKDATDLIRENDSSVNDRSTIESIKKVQEALLAMKFIKNDISFIKESDIKDLGETLGKGDFGIVKLCEVHGIKCAVKSFILKENVKDFFVESESFYLEPCAARKATGPNVVKVLGFSIDPLRIFTEYAENGDLNTFIKKRHSTLSRTERFSIALGILNGLDWVTNVPNILHKDIKPDNILIDKTNTPKISDFGIVQLLEKEDEKASPDGNTLYRAPECYKRSRPYYDKSSVVYAFGLILYLVMTGKTPCPSEIPGKRKRAKTEFGEKCCLSPSASSASSSSLSPSALSEVPADVAEVIQRCTALEPCDRPTFGEASDMLWEAYISKEIPQEAPREFWNTHLGKVFDVQFCELVKEFSVMPNEKVKKVFCDVGCERITPKKFNELYSLFGPWYDPENKAVFNEVVDIIKEEWFLLLPDATLDSVVEGAANKTFGVRISTSKKGSPFCLVFKYKNKLGKYLIERVSMNPTAYKCACVEAVSVQEIVEVFKSKRFIENPYAPEKRDYSEGTPK